MWRRTQIQNRQCTKSSLPLNINVNILGCLKRNGYASYFCVGSFATKSNAHSSELDLKREQSLVILMPAWLLVVENEFQVFDRKTETVIFSRWPHHLGGCNILLDSSMCFAFNLYMVSVNKRNKEKAAVTWIETNQIVPLLLQSMTLSLTKIFKMARQRSLYTQFNGKLILP